MDKNLIGVGFITNSSKLKILNGRLPQRHAIILWHESIK